MSDSGLPPLPPDLPRLYTLRTWLQLQMQAVDQAIARHTRFRLILTRPPSGTASLHRLECKIEGGRVIDYDTAAAAPDEDYIELCPACRPADLLPPARSA